MMTVGHLDPVFVLFRHKLPTRLQKNPLLSSPIKGRGQDGVLKQRTCLQSQTSEMTETRVAEMVKEHRHTKFNKLSKLYNYYLENLFKPPKHFLILKPQTLVYFIGFRCDRPIQVSLRKI